MNCFNIKDNIHIDIYCFKINVQIRILYLPQYNMTTYKNDNIKLVPY